MTVLRAALLFDHPTTRLFASRILESFFFSFAPFVLFLLLLPYDQPRDSFLLPRLTLPRPLRSPLFVLFCYGPFAPDLFSFLPSLSVPATPFPRSRTLVPCQPPSIGVLCKQTHESERRIEGFSCSPVVPSTRRLYFFLLFLVFLLLLTFAKLSEWLRMGKAMCLLSDRNGIYSTIRVLFWLLRAACEIPRARQSMINIWRRATYHLHIEI